MKPALSAFGISLPILLVAGCASTQTPTQTLRPRVEIREQALVEPTIHTGSITAESPHERIIGLAEEEEQHSVHTARR